MFKKTLLVLTIATLPLIACKKEEQSGSSSATTSQAEKEAYFVNLEKTEPLNGFDAAANDCVAKGLAADINDAEFAKMKKMHEDKLKNIQEEPDQLALNVITKTYSKILSCGQKIANPSKELQNSLKSYEEEIEAIKKIDLSKQPAPEAK